LPTPRFENLTSEEAVAVVDAFLGRESSAQFTEKLAGQHITARVSPPNRVQYAIKSHGGRFGGSGYFPAMEQALESFHPKVTAPVTYNFEVIRPSRRPDYIDYPVKKLSAVEYTGQLTQDVARVLNSSQDRVSFLTKDSIKRDVTNLVTDPSQRSTLQRFRDTLASGARVTITQKREVASILEDLVDAGKVPSSLGGPRVEGLFGQVGDSGFKIPSKSYANIQRRQARFYAASRKSGAYAYPQRFRKAVSDPSADGLVSDVLEYIDYMASGGPGPGFRVFFSSTQAIQLKKLADEFRAGDADSGAELAHQFFDRIADRDSWASSANSETNESVVRSDDYFDIVSEALLRAYLRHVI